MAAAAGAHADTVALSSYTPIFQGISEATGTVNGQSAAVIKIDLDAPGISFTSTPLCSGCTSGVTKQTASQFVTSTGVAVAIDSNQYNTNDGKPTNTTEVGLAVSNGTLVSPDVSGTEDVLISKNNQVVFATGGTITNLSGIYNATSASQQSTLIVTNGSNTATTNTGTKVGQSGLGLSQSGEFMYLVDITGTTSIEEEASLLANVGAYNAVALDDGASQELAIANGKGGATVLNKSGTKDIGSNLGIYAAPLTPVPLPPAVWMFGSGVLGLLGIGRRRLGLISQGASGK